MTFLILGVKNSYSQHCTSSVNLTIDTFYISKYDSDLFLCRLAIKNKSPRSIWIKKTQPIYDPIIKRLNKYEIKKGSSVPDGQAYFFIDVNETDKEIFSPFNLPSILLSDSEHLYTEYHSDWLNHETGKELVKINNDSFYQIASGGEININIEFLFAIYELRKLKEELKNKDEFKGIQLSISYLECKKCKLKKETFFIKSGIDIKYFMKAR